MIARIVILVLLGTLTAHADNEPWRVGVTPERMQAAKKLLDEGNELLLARDWPAALTKYQAAIQQWDHPGIRFNVVKCLVQLDRTLEAVDNLEAALKYGAAPLDETVYGEALAYQKMLANQVSTVAVECTQPGVDIRLDGQSLGACPGTNQRRVLPGPHQVVAKKSGFLTHTVDVVVLGGKTQKAVVTLDPLGTSGKVVHRWSTWVPWAVVGAGVLAGGLGGLSQAWAVSNRDAYHESLIPCGDDELGCPMGYQQGLKDRAKLENGLAIGLFVTAGVAIVTGGTMLYMNRGRTVYTKQTEKIEPTASVTPDGATVGISGSF
jgi:tetratricopeptide (TPR) repeat protein